MPSAIISPINPGEAAQLEQTIEMFEVITQSQPHDYQSLEILKEAYTKLGREKEAIGTSKRIAQAYMQMGQLSSAILEYETILQLVPDDNDVVAALKQIESRADSYHSEPAMPEMPPQAKTAPAPATNGNGQKPSRPGPGEVEDGRRRMQNVFVDGKLITAPEFDSCWYTPDLSLPLAGVSEPFIQALANRNILPVTKSLKALSDKSRAAFIPLESYDFDVELARSFPMESCRRWCVLPFDRMSKSVFVATANPFNQQAAKELAAATSQRLLWYLAAPSDLIKCLNKAFR